MTPLGRPGPLTEIERFMFETTGYLVIPDALTPAETAACMEAARRAHAPYRRGEWRQIGHLYETEPAIETLLDHPAVLSKVRALLGDYFIVQSTWCTVQPAGGKDGSYHQDGSSVYEFRRLAVPTPLVQLRVGYFLTDQSHEDMGNMVMLPGSHNAALPLPPGLVAETADLPARDVICGKAGDALLFHQGVYHRFGRNLMDFDRYTLHVVYAPPWLIPSDRTHNDPAFLERTTPLRRALLGDWKRPEEPFGMGYPRPPFDD
jgi:ectoine hydroxylase